MTAPTTDPFATHDKVPTVSFADAKVGTTYTMKVRGPADKVHGNDFETGAKAVWKNDDGTTSPKYSAVVPVTMEDGEDRSVWAVIPSAMFAAMQDGLKAAGKGVFFAEGGTLIIRYTGDKPNANNPRLNPAKQYQAKYTPPAAAPTSADPFAGGAAAPWDASDAPF